MSSKNLLVKTLNELYELMGLSHSTIDQDSGFSILYLQDLFKEYPVSSRSFVVQGWQEWLFCPSSKHRMLIQSWHQ